VLAVVSIAVTLLLTRFATYARWTVGSTPTAKDWPPAGMGAPTTAFVVVSITVTLLLPLATYARWTIGSTPTPKGPIPTGMGVPTTAFVVVSITVTLLSFRLVT